MERRIALAPLPHKPKTQPEPGFGPIPQSKPREEFQAKLEVEGPTEMGPIRDCTNRVPARHEASRDYRLKVCD
jgi:hypothetical protein